MDLLASEAKKAVYPPGPVCCARLLFHSPPFSSLLLASPLLTSSLVSPTSTAICHIPSPRPTSPNTTTADDVNSWSNSRCVAGVKVVIIGEVRMPGEKDLGASTSCQDPYHGPGQAHGMCAFISACHAHVL